MHFRTSRFSAVAAISIAAACAIAAKASAQVPAPLLIGPDRVGSAVTYRLTLSDSLAGSAANVQTLALRWKLGQKVTVTLSSADEAQAMPLVATRAVDGRLTLDNVSADDLDGQRIVMALGLLNRLDGFVASAQSGATAWKTTLAVQPLAPAAPPEANAQSTQVPQPLNIPVAATRSDDATGTTLAASGSINRTLMSPGGGSARGGGRMGGGGMGAGGMGGGGMGRGGGRMSDGSSPKSVKVTTTITVAARFSRDGELTSGTIVETNQAADDQSQSTAQSQPSTRSWQVERTQ